MKILPSSLVTTTVCALGVAAVCFGSAAATFTVTTAASDGPGSFSQAIRDADASSDSAAVITFNIPGAGPHYITPPAAGFPLVLKDNLTVDGYTQPGSSPNTKPITETNNAVLKIVLDARAPNANFRDMAYVFYGTLTTSDPPINNSSMAGSPPGTSGTFERGGFTPNSEIPYERGEVAILGVYRATNVTLKGLAFLGDGSGAEYAIAVAVDYGLDTAVRDRFDYFQGSSKGFHLAGCWVGFDPATGAEHLSGAGVAAFRHRDKGTGGTRPELPNLENMTIGVKAGAATPRAEFNVIGGLGYTIAAEGIRCRVAGNQFLGPADSEIGRYDDAQAPSILFGTDGDGVNDADEGNLFPSTTPTFYGTGNKMFVFAGNIFGLARDGSRTLANRFAVDEFNFSARTKVRFGSDFNGVSDPLEANQLYNTTGFSVNGNAPDNDAWILFRGNVAVNNTVQLPMDEAAGNATYDKFVNLAGPYALTPVISAATTTSLTGTCGLPQPFVAKVVVDICEADPEGELLNFMQGKKYLGSFADNSPADTDPAVGAFTFNTSALGITSGTKLTITANYLRAEGRPTISAIARNPGSTTVAITGGTGPFRILRAPSIEGPYTSIATTAESPATFADTAETAYYMISAISGGGQTSPFSQSLTVP